MFRVPSEVRKSYQRNQWLQNAGLNYEDLPKDARFCEVHFTVDQFERLNFQGVMGLKSNRVPTLFGNNLPKTISAVPEPELNENGIPEIRSPLSNRNENYREQTVELTPVSKRRKAYSMCENNFSETDRLKDSLNTALKQAKQYKKMALIWKKKCTNLSKNVSSFLHEDQIALLHLDDFSTKQQGMEQ